MCIHVVPRVEVKPYVYFHTHVHLHSLGLADFNTFIFTFHVHMNNKTCHSEPYFCEKYQNGCYDSKGSILHAYLLKIDIIK